MKLENRLVAVEIDRANGAVSSIHDKELNSTYAFVGPGFEVTTATGTVRSVKAMAAKEGTPAPEEGKRKKNSHDQQRGKYKNKSIGRDGRTTGGNDV